MGLRRTFKRLLDRYYCSRFFLRRSGLSESVCDTIEFVMEKKLSYLDFRPLSEIALGVREVERGRIPGILVETGCALGGSAIVAASTKSPGRCLRLFDTFELIPPPSNADGRDVHERYAVIKAGKSEGIGGDRYYGYMEDLQNTVKGCFADAGFPVAENSVELVKGLYQDTLNVSQPVAFAHIDCDWHDSVKISLERIAPHMSPGALMIIDDYYAYSGCRKAVDDFLAENAGMFAVRHKSRLQLLRL